MNKDSAPIVSTTRKQTLGDRIRNIASQLRQEDEVQIKATSRILGAAAQLAQNHDQLIDEVVDMVETDLDQSAQSSQPATYTVEQLQQQFGSFSEAKDHFNLKARSWAALVEKLNEQLSSSSNKSSEAKSQSSASAPTPSNSKQDGISQRLLSIENELQHMRGDMNRVIQLLELLVEKLP